MSKKRTGCVSGAAPAGSGDGRLPDIKTSLKVNIYITIGATAVCAVFLMIVQSLFGGEKNHPAVVMKPEVFAEIVKPDRGARLAHEVEVSGPVRNLPTGALLYIESRTEDGQIFYRKVGVKDGRFSKIDFHPGIRDGDYGKEFKLRMFIPDAGVQVLKQPYWTPLPGRYVSEEVTYCRAPENDSIQLANKS